MGCEPGVFSGRPCDWPGCAVSTNPSVSFAHLSSRGVDEEGEVVFRAIGMDVHRSFAQLAVVESEGLPWPDAPQPARRNF